MRVFALLLIFTAGLHAQEIVQASINALPEVSESSGMVSFTVELESPSTVPVILTFSTKGHDAQANKDFVPRDEVLTFTPGQVLKTVNVALIDDLEDEQAQELFQADIVATSPKVVVIKPFALVKIADDEEVFDIQNVTVSEPKEDELTVKARIGRDFPSKDPVILQVGSVDQSAVAGEDYVPYFEQVVFQPGETGKNLELKVLGDKKPELKESFSLEVVGIATDIQLKNPVPTIYIEDEDGVMGMRLTSTTEMSLRGGGGFTVKETFKTGPVRLKLVKNEGEQFYTSDSIVPAYRFFVPGQMTFPSTPGEFSVKKLTGVANGRLDIENALMHYVIGPRKMRCRLGPGGWMPCHFATIHGLMRLEDVHPNDQQLPGSNMLADGFEKVEDADEDGVVVGRKTFEGTVPLPDPNVTDAKEYLTIEIMLIPKQI